MKRRYKATLLVSVVIMLMLALTAPAFADANYENTASHDYINFDPSWGPVSSTYASGGSYHRTSQNDNWFKTTIYGATHVTVLGMHGPSMGKMDILFNGVTTTVDCYHSNVTEWIVSIFDADLDPSVGYPLWIKRNSTSPSGKYAVIDAVVVFGDNANLANEAYHNYEQSDSHIDYTGTWANFGKTQASGGSYWRSSTPGATATIQFYGGSIEYIGMKGTTLGIVDIYLDGVYQTTVDCYASVAVYQQVIFSAGGLATGGNPGPMHTLQLVRNSGSAAGEFLVLDAARMFGVIK